MATLDQPPNTPTLDWGRMKDWLFKLWKTVKGMPFGGDPITYAAAVLASAGQEDAGGAGLLGQAVIPDVYSLIAGGGFGHNDIGGLGFPGRFGGYPGMTDGSSAPAGFVGEYLTANGSTNIAAGTNTNIATLSLTAGDWLVGGSVFHNPSAGLTAALGWISTVSATVPAAGLYYQLNASIGALAMPVPNMRLLLTTTTTVYVSAFANFSSGTDTVTAYVWARRMS